MFSRPPLKFRTAGFPQYGFKRDVGGHLHRNDRLIGRPSPSVVSYAAEAHVSVDLQWTLSSRGPWLARGLCCPAGSSRTMASSEPLAAPPRLICFVRGGLVVASGSPIELHVRSCLPSPAPRWTVAGHAVDSPRRIGLHLICRGSTSTTPRTLVPTWLCNEAESGSLSLRPARLLPFTNKYVYYRAFAERVASGGVGYHYIGNSQLLRPDFHRQDRQPYGLQTDHTEDEILKKAKRRFR